MVRVNARQVANAGLCGLPLTEYLGLPRRERRRHIAAARAEQTLQCCCPCHEAAASG